MGERAEGETMSEETPAAYLIPPTSVRIARRVEEVGRTENFQNSRTLLRRLQQVGERKLVIQSIAEGGKPMPDLHVDALLHYLWAGGGLKYHRRSSHRQDAESWQMLKTRLSI